MSITRQTFRVLAITILGSALSLPNIATAGWSPLERDQGTAVSPASEIGATIAAFYMEDPGIKTFFDRAYGYAVFPDVGKLGIGMGGAYGEGEVFVGSRHIGSAHLTQLSVGMQLGSMRYSEIVFFRDAETLKRFTNGGFELSAQASAMAVNLGKTADARYANGLAIFTLAKGGQAYEPPIGGQKFFYTAKR